MILCKKSFFLYLRHTNKVRLVRQSAAPDTHAKSDGFPVLRGWVCDYNLFVWSYLRLWEIYFGLRSRGKTTASGFLPRTPSFPTCGACCCGAMVILVLGRFGASTSVVQGFISITAPPVDSLRLISGGLRCSGFTPFAPTWLGATPAEYRRGIFLNFWATKYIMFMR